MEGNLTRGNLNAEQAETFRKFEEEIHLDNEIARDIIEDLGDPETTQAMEKFFQYINIPEGYRGLEMVNVHSSKDIASACRFFYRKTIARINEIARAHSGTPKSQSARKALCILQKNYGGGNWQ